MTAEAEEQGGIKRAMRLSQHAGSFGIEVWGSAVVEVQAELPQREESHRAEKHRPQGNGGERRGPRQSR